jgi:hypothetical protein
MAELTIGHGRAAQGDATFAGIMAKVGELSRPGKLDAFGAMFTKAGESLDGISDDLLRELYGFWCGYFNGLLAAGNNSAGALLDVLQAPGVRGDPAMMRRALKTVWEATTA